MCRLLRQLFASEAVELLKSREALRPLSCCLEYQLCRKWVSHPLLKTLLLPIPQVVIKRERNFLKGGRVSGFKWST